MADALEAGRDYVDQKPRMNSSVSSVIWRERCGLVSHNIGMASLQGTALPPSDADLTLILNDWANGDQSAVQRLLPLVYPDLRALASSQLRHGSRRGATLQTTAVVNELFLKLLGRRPPKLENRKHFYVLVAKIMRAALVDHYRQNYALKRGGDLTRVALHPELLWVDAMSEQVLDLDRALDELELLDPVQVELFGMRFLLGCTAAEAAMLSGLSKATVDRKLKLARAWLFQRLNESNSGPTANV